LKEKSPGFQTFKLQVCEFLFILYGC